MGLPRRRPWRRRRPSRCGPAPTPPPRITAADVARRVGIIADDSMMGRDTPSRGLELTAKYVADQFRRFGLKPGGDNGTWFQRYPITRRRLEPAQLARGAQGGRDQRDRAARPRRRATSRATFPDRPVAGPSILVGGPAHPGRRRGGWRCATRSCSTSTTTRTHDPDECHPGRPRDPAGRSRAPSSCSRIWIRRPSPRGCRSTAPERYGVELRTRLVRRRSR